MKPIAHIRTDLPQKFGIPRNSFLAPHLQGRIVFEPEFALNSAVAGLDGFSHAWLLWEFENGTPGGTAQDIAADAATDDKSGTNTKWSPTVRPPRLGGSERMGVFATRSPFRPNPIGLTCVKIDHVELTGRRPDYPCVGRRPARWNAHLDIKPYIPFADCHPDATGGFIDEAPWHELDVDFPETLQAHIESDKLEGLVEVLRQDPRRAGSSTTSRVYHLAFAAYDVAFTVDGDTLHVVGRKHRRYDEGAQKLDALLHTLLQIGPTIEKGQDRSPWLSDSFRMETVRQNERPTSSKVYCPP